MGNSFWQKYHQAESNTEEEKRKPGEEERLVAIDNRETMLHLFITHTHRLTQIYSHGELAELGLDAAMPHAHPGEG